MTSINGNPAGPRQGAKIRYVCSLLSDVWVLMKPRQRLLKLGFVLMAVNRFMALVLPASTKYLIDNVITKHQVRLLMPIVFAVVVATLLQGLTSFTLSQLLSKSSEEMTAELRIRANQHIGRLPMPYYDANNTGTLVSRILSDVEKVESLFGLELIELAGGLITAIFALFVLLRTSISMTGVALLALVLFLVTLSRSLGTMWPIFRAQRKVNAEVTARLVESLGGVRVVKGYHAEEREGTVFGKGVHRLLGNTLKIVTSRSLTNLSATTSTGLLGAVIMLLGARQILSGRMTLGALVTFTIFLGLLVSPVLQIVSFGSKVTEALAGLASIREVLNEKPEDEAPERTVRLDRVVGEIVFEDVGFTYDSVKPVLYDVRFKSNPGTVTAFVGASGAGKSTIIGLTAAFYAPTSGRVLVDGVDLAKVRLDSYRTQLGMVLQEAFLFSGTIRDNVAFSRPEASEQEIVTACRIARVDEFADRFEKKYESLVGERGVRLSGGQKQRISIARAILADPRILILDEATSSLDSESEALIQEGLRNLMRGRTTFVIAHRLSTIRRADQIIVLEAGRIIACGTHDTLYATCSRYYDLYTKQHGLESNVFS